MTTPRNFGGWKSMRAFRCRSQYQATFVIEMRNVLCFVRVALTRQNSSYEPWVIRHKYKHEEHAQCEAHYKQKRAAELGVVRDGKGWTVDLVSCLWKDYFHTYIKRSEILRCFFFGRAWKPPGRRGASSSLREPTLLESAEARAACISRLTGNGPFACPAQAFL